MKPANLLTREIVDLDVFHHRADQLAYLLSGLTAAPRQRLSSNDELVKMASRSLSEVHIELIRRSRIQVQLEG